jgi:hypothetical protein
VKVFHPKRIRKRTYISFYYKLRLWGYPYWRL